VLAIADLDGQWHVSGVIVILAGEECKAAVFKGVESVLERGLIPSNRRR